MDIILAPCEKGPSDILSQQMPENHLLHLLLVATEKKKLLSSPDFINTHYFSVGKLSGFDKVPMKDINFCQNPSEGTVAG